MTSVRAVLNTLGFAFTAYLAARGLWWLWSESVPYPFVILAALGLYLTTTWLCLFWEPRKNPDGEQPAHVRLPRWAAGLAVVCAVIVPSAISFAVGPDARTELYATWYLGGIGALMTIVMARRRPWEAWIGMGALAIASMVWMGAVTALALGLVGSIVWVTIAQLLVWSMDRAARDTTRLARLQRAASAWQAAQGGRQRERRVQVQRALAVAGPVLAQTVAAGGSLTAEERDQARTAEGTLRDELRGGRLLDDDVREALAAVRRRGTAVTVLDEGGLDGIGDEPLVGIRAQLAEALRDAHSDRLYIRTSPHDTIAVTIVGRSGVDGSLSDEDNVDLWLEIAR